MKPCYRTRLALAGLLGALFICLVSIPLLARSAPARSSNPPLGRTGAPGEGTCNQCHDGALNDGQETFTLSGVPAAYSPGQTYTLTVSLRRSGAQRWGFQITSLFVSDDTYAGTLQSTTDYTFYGVTGGRGYVSQTTSPSDGTYEGTFTGPVSWTLDWTAPPAGGGTVRFYVVGVAADGSGSADSGDRVYTKQDVESAEGVTTATAETTWGWIKNHYR